MRYARSSLVALLLPADHMHSLADTADLTPWHLVFRAPTLKLIDCLNLRIGNRGLLVHKERVWYHRW
jgi:hypothetical protein